MPAVFVPAFKASLQPRHFVKVFDIGGFLIGRIIAILTRLDDIDVAEHGGGIESLSDNTLGGIPAVIVALRSSSHCSSSMQPLYFIQSRDAPDKIH